jgi:hypothetical protein
MTMMRTELIGLLCFAVFATRVPGQEQPMAVKGGHQLGETVEQFFSEGQEKEALSACATGHFKSLDKLIRSQVKKDCDELAGTRQRAMDGKREDYHGVGDPSEMRKDTFTFDGGHLVKVELLYAGPSAEFNYRGQSFEKILAGVIQANGPPTSESTKPTQDAYGVPYVAHRELWLTPQTVILITEQPGPRGSTILVAFTRAEYDRTVAAGAPNPANPLE